MEVEILKMIIELSENHLNHIDALKEIAIDDGIKRYYDGYKDGMKSCLEYIKILKNNKEVK